MLIFGLVLLLLDNRRFPAALAALAAGIVAGVALGGLTGKAVALGPTDIHLIKPTADDFWTAFIMLILPQIPLTIGNACVGVADACVSLFPDNPQRNKVKAGRFGLADEYTLTKEEAAFWLVRCGADV